MVCRIMGLGMVADSGETIENGCPIQADFPAYRSLPPEPFDLETWEGAEGPAKAAAAGRLLDDDTRGGYETTIAAAILVWGTGSA